jgi:hypothetical protein
MPPFKLRPPERQPDDRLLWQLKKDSRIAVAYVRALPDWEAIELRYDMDGRFLRGELYRGERIALLESDAEAMRRKLHARGWQES